MERTGAGYASGEVGDTPFCTPVTMKQDGTERYFERETGRKWRVEWGENGGKGVCCDMWGKIQISPSPDEKLCSSMKNGAFSLRSYVS